MIFDGESENLNPNRNARSSETMKVLNPYSGAIDSRNEHSLDSTTFIKNCLNSSGMEAIDVEKDLSSSAVKVIESLFQEVNTRSQCFSQYFLY